ncbi:MAG: hypothetical protein H6815_13560 [Phycisphaeraceae bacterium]|nr:hypothetical protein [Phycisphaerales bacterium]MCB9861466.1 hypothetical protein [Phycisphaeraceae bacterium]
MSVTHQTNPSRLPAQVQQKLVLLTTRLDACKGEDITRTAMELLTLVDDAIHRLAKPSAVQNVLTSLGVATPTSHQIADYVVCSSLSKAVSCWHKLNSDTQSLCTNILRRASSPVLKQTLTLAVEKGHAPEAVHIAGLIDSSTSWEYTASLVTHQSAETASLAAHAIDDRVCSLARREMPTAVASAVPRLLIHWERHKQASILHASLVLCAMTIDGQCKADINESALLEDAAPYAHELRTRLRRSRHPATYALALRWLKHPTVAVAAMDRLSSPPSNASEIVAKMSHLLMHPARSRVLQDGLLFREGTPTPSNARNGISLLKMAVASNTSQHAIEHIVEQLAVSTDAHARLASIPYLPASPLRDVQFDPNGNVALCATLASWWEKNDKNHIAVEQLTRHIDERVRCCARLLLESLPEHTPASTKEQVDSLRNTLVHAHAVEKARAIRIALDLHLLDELLHEVSDIATSATPEPSTLDTLEYRAIVRAQAIAASALGHASNIGAAQQALQISLQSSDDRVRANAVESLFALARTQRSSGLHGHFYSSMIELKEDHHQRVRANALKNLLLFDPLLIGTCNASSYDPVPIAAIETMLHDNRTAHQISALWVLRRVAQSAHWRAFEHHWPKLMSCVSRIAKGAVNAQLLLAANATHAAMQRAYRQTWLHTADTNADQPLRVSHRCQRRAVTSTR